MNTQTQVAIIGNKHLSDELKAALPGFRFVHWEATATQELVEKLREAAVGMVVASIPDRISRPDLYQSIAKEALHSGIISLFWSTSQNHAYVALAQHYFNSNVGAVSSVLEVKPMVNLIRERMRQEGTIIRAPVIPEAESDLDDHPLVQQTTSFLRAKHSGRLDVRKIAALYDEPLKRFAEALDVSPAAVSQTPDSKAYQARLGYFERAARIIPLLQSKDDFAAWSKTPNKELKGRTPIDLLFGTAKDAQQLVDTVEDVLTGQPD